MKIGSTGIGFIVFRDKEFIIVAVVVEVYHEFFNQITAKYKGKVELWY